MLVHFDTVSVSVVGQTPRSWEKNILFFRLRMQWIDWKVNVKLGNPCRTVHGNAPPYLTSSFTGVVDMPHRRTLRSSSTDEIDVPFFCWSMVGGRAFPVAGAEAWNTLPSDVTSASSLPFLRNRLKTYLFRRCYDMILSDHNLYPHWFGYHFPLHSCPCDSLNYLGHF